MPWRNAPEFFFPRYGAAHGHAQEPTSGSAVEFWGGGNVRKNRPLVLRSNIAGSWARGGGGCPIVVLSVRRRVVEGWSEPSLPLLFLVCNCPSIFS